MCTEPSVFLCGKALPAEVLSDPIVVEWLDGRGSVDNARLALATLHHALEMSLNPADITSSNPDDMMGLPDRVSTRLTNMCLRSDMPNDLVLAAWQVRLLGEPSIAFITLNATGWKAEIEAVAMKWFVARVVAAQSVECISSFCAAKFRGHLRVMKSCPPGSEDNLGAVRAVHLMLPILSTVPSDVSVAAIESALDSSHPAVRKAAIATLVTTGPRAVRALGTLHLLGQLETSLHAETESAISQIVEQFVTAHRAGTAPEMTKACRAGLARLAAENGWSTLCSALLE